MGGSISREQLAADNIVGRRLRKPEGSCDSVLTCSIGEGHERPLSLLTDGLQRVDSGGRLADRPAMICVLPRTEFQAQERRSFYRVPGALGTEHFVLRTAC